MAILNDLNAGKNHWNRWQEKKDKKPPNLSNLKIEAADLRGYKFNRCRCYGTDFGESQVFRADFRGAHLQDADLSNVRGLTENALAGADLRGTRLPDYISFTNLEVLQDSGPKLQRFQWMTLIFGVLFLLSLTEVDSQSYFSPQNNLFRFSISGGWSGSLSVMGLIIFATLMITTFSLMVHFFIRRLWWEWQSLPLWFPDGKTRRQKFVSMPWVEVVRIREPIPSRKSLHIGIRTVDLLIAMVFFFPILVLFIAWIVILPFHSQLLSTTLLACNLILVGSFFHLTYPRHPKFFQAPPWGLVMAIVGVLLTVYSLRMLNSGWETHATLWTFGLWMFYLAWQKFILKRSSNSPAKGSMWRRERPFRLPALLALLVPLFIWCCFGWTVQRYLFHNMSPNWPLLQANLTVAQLSQKTGEFVKDADYKTNRFKVKGVQFSQRNLNGAQFVGSFLFDAVFKEAQLVSANLSNTDSRGAQFQKANLVQAVFDGANLAFSNFSGANLSQANFGEAQIIQVDFSDANLTEAQTRQTQMRQITAPRAIMNGLWLKKAHFTGDTSQIQLRGAKLTNASFENCNLEDADFFQATLTDANFRQANLKGNINFQQAWLKGADFTNAMIDGADFRSANLATAQLAGVRYLKNATLDGLYFNDLALFNLVFEGSSLVGCNFESATLQGANFSNTNLEDAVFEKANLKMANFSGASLFRTKMRCLDMKQASFYNADLRGLNLSYSDLRNTNFQQAFGFDDSISPCIIQGALIDPKTLPPDFASWAIQNGALVDPDRYEAAKKSICF